MEYELIHKGRLYCVVLSITVLFVLLLCGCDPRSGQYPFQKAEYWESYDPPITLRYAQNDDHTWSSLEELHWKGDFIKIDMARQSDYFCVYPAESSNHGDRLFAGSWKYRKGNLVLIIKEDFIFGNQYSEIVLVPVS